MIRSLINHWVLSCECETQQVSIINTFSRSHLSSQLHSLFLDWNTIFEFNRKVTNSFSAFLKMHGRVPWAWSRQTVLCSHGCYWVPWWRSRARFQQRTWIQEVKLQVITSYTCYTLLLVWTCRYKHSVWLAWIAQRSVPICFHIRFGIISSHKHLG